MNKIKKTIIITGASDGLGLELTKALAFKGFRVIMACRNLEKANTAKNNILKKNKIDSRSLVIKHLDLSDFKTVQKFADEILDENNPIEILVNNAGIMDVNFQLTIDNNELVYQTNYLGHYMLTLKLLPLIKNRIVNVCSLFANFGKINDVNNVQCLNSIKYNKRLAYENSKLANLMFSVELSRYLASKNSSVISVACHPGYTKTGIVNNNSSGLGCFYAIGNAILAQSTAKGIIPILHACLNDVKSGEYYGPSGLCELFGNKAKRVKVPFKNFKLCKELWDATAKLLRCV